MGSKRAQRAMRWAAIFSATLFVGCAAVKQKDREFLSDPILQIRPDDMSQGLEEHNRPRREGAVGGSSGDGGGCGC